MLHDSISHYHLIRVQATWAEMHGLTDTWRWRHPQSCALTCHSASQKTFFRIDLAYVWGSFLPRIREIRILLSGVSNHGPLFTSLDLFISLSDRLFLDSGSRIWQWSLSSKRRWRPFGQSFSTWFLQRLSGMPLKLTPVDSTRPLLQGSVGNAGQS